MIGRRAMLAGGTGLLAGCATGGDQPLRLAQNVDLDRYFGRWTIIANIPYFAERGNVDGMVEYYRRPDGQIADVYLAREKGFDSPVKRLEGRAYVVEGTGNALWRTTFLWPIYFTYPILYVDEGYTTALIGYPDRSLGWVFSRSRTMDEPAYQAALARFASQGYDISRFERVPQKV